MIDLRFVVPDLRVLDEASAEVVVTSIHSDERPFGGLAGLFDFRLAGRLSRLARERFLDGERGELFAMPVRPRLPFDKLLVVGLGPRDAFDETSFRDALGRVLDALVGLEVKKAVLELPGRSHERFDVDLAVDALLERTADDAHDALALVEDPESQKRIERRVLERRRAAMRGQLA